MATLTQKIEFTADEVLEMISNHLLRHNIRASVVVEPDGSATAFLDGVVHEWDMERLVESLAPLRSGDLSESEPKPTDDDNEPF